MSPTTAEGDRERALNLIPVSRETEAIFEALIALLDVWQRRMNLVSPSTMPLVWTRHLADSAQLVTLAPNVSRWLDLGSGGGFPGLVVAILLRDQPQAEVHLVESNGRKVAFLREAARRLALPVVVHHARIETILPKLGVKFEIVSARALAPLKVLIPLTKELLKTDCVGLFLKGRDVEGELTEARRWWRFTAELIQSQTDPQGRIVRISGLQD